MPRFETVNVEKKATIADDEALRPLIQVDADLALCVLRDIVPELAERISQAREFYRGLPLESPSSAEALAQFESSFYRQVWAIRMSANHTLSAPALKMLRAVTALEARSIREMNDDIKALLSVEPDSELWWKLFDAERAVVSLARTFDLMPKSFEPQSLEDLQGDVRLRLAEERTAFVVEESGERMALIFDNGGKYVEQCRLSYLLSRYRIESAEEGALASPSPNKPILLPCLYREVEYFQPGDIVLADDERAACIYQVDHNGSRLQCMSTLDLPLQPVEPASLGSARIRREASELLLFRDESVNAARLLLRLSPSDEPQAQDPLGKIREAYQIGYQLDKAIAFESLAGADPQNRGMARVVKCLKRLGQVSEGALLLAESLDHLPTDAFTPELLDSALTSLKSNPEANPLAAPQSVSAAKARTIYLAQEPEEHVRNQIEDLGDSVYTATSDKMGMEYSGNELARYTRLPGTRTVCIYAPPQGRSERVLAAVAIYRSEEVDSEVLMRMAVSPQFQKTGISNRLFFSVMADLVTQGMATYSGTQRLQNRAAMKFQHRWGATLDPQISVRRAHQSGELFAKIRIVMAVDPKIRKTQGIQPQGESFLTLMDRFQERERSALERLPSFR